MAQLDANIPLSAMGADPRQPQQQMNNALQVFQMKDAMQQRGQAQQAQLNEKKVAKKLQTMTDKGTGLFLRYQGLKDKGFSEAAAHAAMQEDWQREIGGLAAQRHEDGSPMFETAELEQLGGEFKAGELGMALTQMMGAQRALDMYFKQREQANTQAKTAADERRVAVTERNADIAERRLSETERSNRESERIKEQAASGGSEVITNEDGTQTVVPKGKKTPIPSEIQSRMALGENYAKQVPDLLAAIDQGKSGALGTAFNAGTSGVLAKRQESGVDALVRNLTGAGKSKEEAASYASRYQFEATDSDARKKEKVLQLVSELKAIDEAVKTGRGWPASTAYEGIGGPAPLANGGKVGGGAGKYVRTGKNKAGQRVGQLPDGTVEVIQ